ncbi:uncharacterized protein METZ01_LOCUS438868, partial [marine metagenome]
HRHRRRHGHDPAGAGESAVSVRRLFVGGRARPTQLDM